MKSFYSTDPVSHSGKTNTWLTPLSLVRELGEFDLDPCGFPDHDTAKKLICLPDDGLAADWAGRVWLNPPYGKHAVSWLEKLDKHGNGIALIFGRLETQWIKPFVRNGYFQIEGRISFLNSDKNTVSNAGSSSILVPFGRENLGRILISGIKGRWFQ